MPAVQILDRFVSESLILKKPNPILRSSKHSIKKHHMNVPVWGQNATRETALLFKSPDSPIVTSANRYDPYQALALNASRREKKCCPQPMRDHFVKKLSTS